MRRRLVGLQERCRARMGALGSVPVVVTEPHGVCPLCGERMLVQKTVPRIGRTLAHGCFEAQETVRVCAAGCHWPSGTRVTQRAVCLSEALVPRTNFGYDVMVFVGRERFGRRRQRDEIQAALRVEHGIPISTGEVSKLARRFLGYFARLHRVRAPQLREALANDGGWPMHIDATGEHGRGTLFVVMAGWRRWVLGAWKISTERTELLSPCLDETVRLFGWPCAIMRDMGKPDRHSGTSLALLRFCLVLVWIRALFGQTAMSQREDVVTQELFHELLSQLGVDVPPGSVLPISLQNAVESVVSRAQSAFPELDVDLPEFLGYLAEKISQSNQKSNWGRSLDLLSEALSAVHVEDLYLAFGCGMKVPTAIELFERRHMPYIEQVCHGEPRHGFSPDDVVQHVRVKLFVPKDGRPPKIFSYSGRGFLRSWLHTVVSRALLDEYRRQKYLMEQLTDRFTALPDPEVAFLKEKYRQDFRDSFEDAVSTLASRERNLLRLRVLGDLTLEQLAALFRVNRTTIVRKLIKIRKKILFGTRRGLVRKLGCQPDEVGSILRLIESQLEVSFSRILGTEEEDE